MNDSAYITFYIMVYFLSCTVTSVYTVVTTFSALCHASVKKFSTESKKPIVLYMEERKYYVEKGIDGYSRGEISEIQSLLETTHN